jgi:outer membrane protein assembly factor BamB
VGARCAHGQDALDVPNLRGGEGLDRQLRRDALHGRLQRAHLRPRRAQRPSPLRSAAQPRLGARGAFYSTPAIAYGRVYIGSTDGKVYSFGAASGKLRWSRSTGGYVYASPAVWRGLVLVGSYDHRFYAFDAATGETRWTFAANGPISGAASVIDGVVYFSTFADRTYALAAETGRLLWSWPDGHYSPAVADESRLYVVGLGRLYGMVSKRRPAAHG